MPVSLQQGAQRDRERLHATASAKNSQVPHLHVRHASDLFCRVVGEDYPLDVQLGVSVFTATTDQLSAVFVVIEECLEHDEISYNNWMGYGS